MTALFAGLLAGIPVGAASAALIGAVRRRQARDSGLADSFEDRIVGEVEAYRLFMQQRIDAFADRLAGDDELLRERLRHVQSGGTP